MRATANSEISVDHINPRPRPRPRPRPLNSHMHTHAHTSTDKADPISLAGTITRAVQPAVHDVTDGSVVRAWLNVPLSSSLDSDLFKATNIVRSFASIGQLGPERGLPASVLSGAAGFALLSTVKVRFRV